MPGLPPRLELARELVLERTGGFVLELGCGRGVLAAALMGRVDEYLGVDRSAHAVDASRRRLAALETTTRWAVHHGTLDTVPAPQAAVDLAVAVNVNLFWAGSARRELDRLSTLLTPNGCLVLVYQTPGGADDRLLDPLARSLGEAAHTWQASRRHGSLAVVAIPGEEGLMTVGSRARRRWWVLPAAALLLVGACDGTEPRADEATPTASVASTEVALPEGYEPVVVTPWGDDLLVGSRAPEGSASRPRLTVLEASGGSREVEVSPVSPTAFQAKWLVAAPRGATVELVAGAPAGAHSNTRWSTWRGDASGVRELPQPFSTFGGWGAGALVSLVQTPSTPVVVGSWESGGAGLDIALWHPQGERWVRASSAGTALASSATELVSARGATVTATGVLVVGSVTLLGEGSVTQRPAVWRSPGPTGPWVADRPARCGALGEAHAASCDDAGSCTVVGVVDGMLRGWTLAADGAVSALGTAGAAGGRARPAPGAVAGRPRLDGRRWPPGCAPGHHGDRQQRGAGRGQRWRRTQQRQR